MAGRLPILTYLLNQGADADAVDGDGWTALHNACSRGYLDLVKCLIETAHASVDIKGGRGAWTPLMNAASNGHLPIVRFLTSKYHVDPFQRNLAGETAYDVAAASFEIFICGILEKYEAERYNALKFVVADEDTGSSSRRDSVKGQYNPLCLHTTVPVVIHQNERLDTRLSTLAVHGGKPRWSGTGAGRPHKPDRRAPGTMPPGPMSPYRTREIPMRREDIQLPRRKLPYKLQLPSRGEQLAQARCIQRRQQQQQQQQSIRDNADEFGSTPTPESVLDQHRASSQSQNEGAPPEHDEPSHFWICEWQLDRTHPHVDPIDGWQYAQSFDAPEDRWTALIPPQLTRLLEGKGLGSSLTRSITAGTFSGPAGHSSSTSGADSEVFPHGWVRRRRWVRVMRRRLDIEFGDELEAAEFTSLSVKPGELPSRISEVTTSNVARDARLECDALESGADYLARAKALAGRPAREGVTPADALEEDAVTIQGRITRLELAIAELRGSAFGDEDPDRRSDAEGLLKEFTLQIGQLRQAAGIAEGSDGNDEDEDEDEEEFIYPNSFKDTQSMITRIGGGQPETVRPAIGQHHSSSASVFGAGITRSVAVGVANHRSVDLARASEFRVPTNESPNSMFSSSTGTSMQAATLIPTWERDENARDCRGCGRRFTFFTRKHHCRRCGRIYCADCSSYREQLTAEELVIDPEVPEMFVSETTGGASRICGTCHAERQLPAALRTPRGADQMLRSIAKDRGAPFGAVPGTEDGGPLDGTQTPLSDVSSRASELNECPVCNFTLAHLGSQAVQEEHIRQCLDNGGGGSIQGRRYLVYRLPADSPIVSKECVICLEELLTGHAIARLPCLCFFHKNCIDSWLARGRSCPTHAR